LASRSINFRDFFCILDLLAYPDPNEATHREAYFCYVDRKEEYDNKAKEAAKEYQGPELNFGSSTNEDRELVSTDVFGEVANEHFHTRLRSAWQSEKPKVRPPGHVPCPGRTVFSKFF
jgi:hypothetical protein